MPFRALLSAALTASLLAVAIVVLTLFLNPDVTLRGDGAALLTSLFLPYALAGTAVFLLVPLLGSWIRWWPRMPRPPLDRLPWFTSLAFLALLLAASLYWTNLLQYRYSIPLEFVRALAASAVAITLAALVLVAVGVDAVAFPASGRGGSAAVVVLASCASVILPLALLPTPRTPLPPVPLSTETVKPVRRVVLVGLDGMGPKQIREGVARGALPGFARILRRGAYGPLATLRPTDGPPIWTTIFTGRFPRDHGVKSFSTYRLGRSRTVCEILPKGALVGLLERVGLVSTSPVTAASRKKRALWDALNAFGMQTGIVRFWGTQPPEHVRGFMLSNYFHLLRGDPARVQETLYPKDLLPEVMARAVSPPDVDRGLVSQFLDVSVEIPHDQVPWRRDLVERALAPDLTYQRAGEVLRAAYDPPFFATYYYGLDVVGHSFTRYAKPDLFGDVSPDEVRRYGAVTERYAAEISQWVGELAQRLRPGEILLVVSGYGMEPVGLWRRVASTLLGEPAMSGTHANAPDGFLMAVGDGIRPGASLQNASVLDVAPTILYLMGLPVARDMEGRVATEILEDGFARSHPVTFIPSYESLAVTPMAAPGAAALPPLPEEGP
jgi:predicted AlkP superfamily phosphohydrolase/phosphomutase